MRKVASPTSPELFQGFARKASHTCSRLSASDRPHRRRARRPSLVVGKLVFRLQVVNDRLSDEHLNGPHLSLFTICLIGLTYGRHSIRR